MKTNKKNTALLNSIKLHAIEGIENRLGSSCYGADLHGKLFSEDYFLIGRYNALCWLKEHYGFEAAVGKIYLYEVENFGDVSTNLHEPESVCNMLVYILGEELLQYSPTLQQNWDNLLSTKDMKKIQSEIKKIKLTWVES